MHITWGYIVLLVLQYLLAQKEGEEQFILFEQRSDHVLKKDFGEGGFNVLGSRHFVWLFCRSRSFFHRNIEQFCVEFQGELIHWLDVCEHHHREVQIGCPFSCLVKEIVTFSWCLEWLPRCTCLSLSWATDYPSLTSEFFDRFLGTLPSTIPTSQWALRRPKCFLFIS